jgi:3-hydroxybutyryl-CoA dehydrogenase
MIGRNEPSLRALRARIGDSLQLFQRHGLLSQEEA